MSILLFGDCLEEMKSLDDNSIDFIFCDLPYATEKYSAINCKWNTPIDLDKFWIEIMRIKKLNTPIFMTTTTKFGVDLINSAPKKCPFRYDLVWVKAPCGFLCAKKMPMRKHEMVYVFYEKLPFYDLSSHKHKFIKEEEDLDEPNEEYDKRDKKVRNTFKKEENYGKGYLDKKINFRKYDPTLGGNGAPSHLYDPPLPVSVVNEKYTYKQDKEKDLYGTDIRKEVRQGKDVGKSPIYDPPLPTTMLEIKSTRGKHSTEKPVALMEWLLKYYSKEGDIVLDPTMGSGSTGVACKNMNRNFIGIEMDPEIYEVAVNRLED
jgi:site-specific DNA-methyltransferase (adenine-specific)